MTESQDTLLNGPYNGQFYEYWPADPSIAAGPSAVVISANSEIQIYDKNTRKPLLAEGAAKDGVPLFSFYKAVPGLISNGGNFFDTRAEYDASQQKFVIVTLYRDGSGNHANDRILVAVSKTSDPTAKRKWSVRKDNATIAWDFTSIQSMIYFGSTGAVVDVPPGTNPPPGAQPYFADFPGIASGPSGVYITPRYFPVAGGEGPIAVPTYFQVPWNAVLGSNSTISDPAGSGTAYVHAVDQSGSPNLYQVLPIQENGSHEPYLIGFNYAVGSPQQYLDIVDPTQTAGQPSSVSAEPISVDVGNVSHYDPQTAGPELAFQSGTGAPRVESQSISTVYAAQVGQTIYALNTITPPGGNAPETQFYSVNLNTLTCTTTYPIASPVPGANSGTMFPSIAADNSGDLGMAFNGSSVDNFVSLYDTVLFNGGPSPLPATESSSGQATLDLNDNYSADGVTVRLGDFTSTASDTDGQTFWSDGEFALSNGQWGTTVASFKAMLSKPSVNAGSVSGTQLSLTGTADAGAAVNIYVRRGKPGKTTSPTATVTADSNGGWSAQVPVTGNGPYSVWLIATWPAGGPQPSAPFHYKYVAPKSINRSMPPVISGIGDGGAILGGTVNGAHTSDNTVVFHGYADPYAVVTITQSGGSAIGTAHADPSGQWTFDYSQTPLANGSYTYTAGDDAGNTSVPFTVVIGPDEPAPELGGILDAYGGYTRGGFGISGVGGTLTLQGTTAYPGDTVSVYGGDNGSGGGGGGGGGDDDGDGDGYGYGSDGDDDDSGYGGYGGYGDAVIASGHANHGKHNGKGGKSGGIVSLDASPDSGNLLGSATADSNGDWSIGFDGSNLPPDGYFDAVAQESGANGTSDSPVIRVYLDSTPPTVTSVIANPDDSGGPGVGSIDITFSEPVTGLVPGDFQITNGTNTTTLSGATLDTSDDTTWTLGNLGGVTSATGVYTLTDVNPQNVVDDAENPLGSFAPDTFLVLNGDSGGTATNDVFELAQTANGSVGVYIGGSQSPTYTFAAGTLGQILVNGESGNDSLTDELPASLAPSSGVSFIGGDGNDSLNVITSAGDTVSSGDGVITDSDGTSTSVISYDDTVENVSVSSGAGSDAMMAPASIGPSMSPTSTPVTTALPAPQTAIASPAPMVRRLDGKAAAPLNDFTPSTGQSPNTADATVALTAPLVRPFSDTLISAGSIGNDSVFSEVGVATSASTASKAKEAEAAHGNIFSAMQINGSTSATGTPGGQTATEPSAPYATGADQSSPVNFLGIERDNQSGQPRSDP